MLIPSAGTRKAFDSAPLYHHIPIEDCQIPLIADELNSLDDIIEEPYEEEYGKKIQQEISTNILPTTLILQVPK